MKKKKTGNKFPSFEFPKQDGGRWSPTRRGMTATLDLKGGSHNNKKKKSSAYQFRFGFIFTKCRIDQF